VAVLLAMKEKVVELVGDMELALQLLHDELVVMNLVSVGTSTCTMKEELWGMVRKS
jgi:hypothetical protein